MSQKNTVLMKLVFSRTQSDSQAVKIRDFWKFIDSQDEIQLYKKSEDSKGYETSNERYNNVSVCSPKNGENFHELERRSNDTCEENIEDNFWFNELQLFRALGLDKIALSTCKYRDSGASKNNIGNLILSDMVDQTREEVEADLKDFETRLKNKQ